LDALLEERKRKADKIVELYSSRSYRQEDVAKEFNIPISIVAKVLTAYSFEHGKELSFSNPCNLNPGQAVKPVILYTEMEYLDKYSF